MNIERIVLGFIVLFVDYTHGKDYGCGGSIAQLSGNLDYKFGQRYEAGESCAWILKTNNEGKESNVTIQLLQDGFKSARITLFALSEGGDLQTLESLNEGYRGGNTWTAHIFLIIFTSDTRKVNGTGFRLRFIQVGKPITESTKLTVKSIYVRTDIKPPTKADSISGKISFLKNELWLIVFQPAHNSKGDTVSINNIDIGSDCNKSKLLAYYTYDGVPSFTRRHCQKEDFQGYQYGSNPFVMTFRTGNEVQGKGFNYEAYSYTY